MTNLPSLSRKANGAVAPLAIAVTLAAAVVATLVGLAQTGHLAWAETHTFLAEAMEEAGNDNPRGIWTDGTTMWVSDVVDDKIYAYDMATSTHAPGEDFDTLKDAGNTNPSGIWSNGTTMWVTDTNGSRIYAYRMSNRARDQSQEFDTSNQIDQGPRGVWSDGTTMWASDWARDMLLAYRMSDRTYDSEKNFRTLNSAGNNSPEGIWSDGTTMWVSDFNDGRIYAYRMSDKVRVSHGDVRAPDEAGIVGITSDGITTDGISSTTLTMWVFDQGASAIYSYEVRIPPPCHDDMGFGRVHFRPRDNACIILDKIIVKVHEDHTVEDAEDGLNGLPGWQVVGAARSLGFVFGRYSPDNLTLQELGDQARLINNQPWAERISYDSLVGPAEVETESEATQNTPATGAPTIDGTPQVGQTLSAETSEIGDADGLTNSAFTYQWIRSDGTTDTDIAGATGSTYTLVSDDLDKSIQVRVSFTDDAGYEESLTSTATAVVAQNAGVCDRTLQVRDAIVEAVPDVTSCEEITTSQLAALDDILELISEDIGTLKTGDFQGLSNLKGLDLTYNSLTELPDGVFDSLPNLEGLDLTGNSLTELPEGVFDNLPKLKGLWLDSNELTELPDGVFDNLTKLQELGLATNDLAELPDGAFDNQAKLQELGLASNGLAELPDGVFDNLSNLRRLRIGGNPEIRELEEGIFDNLSKLRLLNIAGNGLGGLPVGVFDNLTNLRELYLHANEDLASLPDGVFDSLTQLQRLRLDDNGLTTLPAGVFDNQGNLLELLLSNQGHSGGLTELPDGVFDELTELTYLGLDSNKFTELPDGIFDNTTKLVRLRLHHNDLTELPDSIKDLSKLTGLYLYSNELTTLPDGMFDNMPNLVELEMGHSGQTGLPDGISGLTQLKRLGLQSVGITELPEDAFESLSALEFLDLRANELTALPDGIFANLSELRKLDLALNNLSSLPAGTFSGLSNLRRVSLDQSTPPGVHARHQFKYAVLLEWQDDETLSVRMDKAPPFPVKVTLSATGGDLSPSVLHFEPGDWSTRTVTVSSDSEGDARVPVTGEAVMTSGAQSLFESAYGAILLPFSTSALSGVVNICDRTPAVRTAILDVIPGVYDCAEVTASDLGSITGVAGSIDLSNMGLSSLKSGDFDGLVNLDRLNLEGNNLTALPEDIFRDPRNLGRLNLSGNDLTALPGNVFRDLGNLYWLWLSGNELAELPEGVFRDLRNLDWLTLSSNELAELPEGVFDGLNNLTSLSLDYNSLRALPDNIFQGLDSVEDIGLGENSLAALPDGIFDGLAQLETLSLSGNEIHELPDDIFQDLNNVVHIFLGYNNLVELPEGVFDGLSELSTVDLQGNYILQLPDGIFQGLTNLNAFKGKGNPGSPFSLTAELEETGETTVEVHIAPGTPFDMLVTLSAEEGTLSDTAVTVPAGSTRSDPITVTPAGVEAVTISVESATLDLQDPYNRFTIQGAVGRPLTLGEEAEPNEAPTGMPVISGTVWEGETLTASISAIADANGLTNAAFTYQWFRNDGNVDSSIVRAREQSYTLRAGDIGKTTKVRVDFTDDAGYRESLTSATTRSVSGGFPQISGTPQVGQVLTASTSTIVDADGLNNAEFTYEWLYSRTTFSQETRRWTYLYTVISGATDPTYTLQPRDEDEKIAVRVSFTDDVGNEETLTSEATVDVVPEAVTVPDAPRNVAVTPTDHGHLVVTWEPPLNNGGSTITAYVVQWKESGDSWDERPDRQVRTSTHTTSHEIQGLNASRFPIESSTYDVRVIAANVVGNGPSSEEATATPYTSLFIDTSIPNVPATGGPTIVGQARVGQTLTADVSGIEDGNGLPTGKFYRWVSNDRTSDQRIPGTGGYGYPGSANLADTYVPSEQDVGKTIKVIVYFADDAGYAEELTSAEIGPVVAGTNSPATGAPEINGTVQVGETLTVNVSGISDGDGLTRATYNYQWLSDGDSEIEGATSSTYVLQASEFRKTIKARVTFRDDVGSAETLTSAPTDPVAAGPNNPAAGTPTISGMVRVGRTLTVDISDISDADGLNNATYDYQWLSSRDTEIAGATNTTYTLQDTDIGKSITVRVSFADDFGYEEALTSDATAPVEGLPPLPPPPNNLQASTQRNGTVKLAWEAPADAEVTGYRIQRLRVGGDRAEPQTLVEDTGSTGTSYHDKSARLGVGYEYRVSALNETGPGDASDWVTAQATEDTSPEPTDRTNGLRASVEAGAVILNWNAPDDDSDVAMYRILRHRPEEGETEPLVYVDYTLSRATSYSDTEVESGTLYVYSVQAADFFGFLGEASDPASVRVPGSNSPATGAPTISGIVQVGETLTADPSGIFDSDGLANATFSYQWLADDTGIAGAAGSGYTLMEADEGKTIKVRVSFTDDAGNEETLTSAATAAVAATVPGVPSSVAAEPGGTGKIDVSWQEPDSNGGSAITSYTVQWKEAADSWDTAADVSEATTTDTTYTITSLTLGVEYSVRVIATNSAGDGQASEEATATADAQTSQQQGDSENTPAAGSPTISGTPEVRQTLSVETSAISDADGLANAAFTYQWISTDGITDTDIAGATGSTYTLVSNDEDKTIKVRVSFTDDSGNDETLTSAATAAVEAALTAELQGVPNSHNGSGTFTFRILFSEPVTVGFAALKEHSFQVSNATIKRAQRVNGRNDLRKFTIRPSSDAAVELVLPATADCDDEGAICTSDRKRLSTRLEIIVPGPANTAATGTPTISGTLEVGQTLTASTSGIADADGLGNVSFSYQWIANDGATDTDIQGATGSTYTLTESDEGKTIKVQVNFTDDRDNEETLTSAATAAVSAAPTLNNPSTGAPAISGTARVGETLTADTLGISDEDGLDNVSFAYQWLADDAEIHGATGSTYTLTDTQEGTVIEVRVTFTDDGGNEETLTSAATVAVEARPNNPATGAPIINGTAQVGETLTADTSDISDANGTDNATFLFQWLANDADIAGATDSAYTVADADEGKTIRVRVSFTDDAGHDETLTSTATAAVTPAPPQNNAPTGAPNTSGTVNVGHVLTADVTSIDDQDGLDDAQFTYQWLADDTPITGATDATYLLTASEKEQTITVTVSFTDDEGNEEALTSAATVAVTTNPLAASMENKPNAHDGQNDFTFELRFSEQFGLSYQTLTNHAFTVVGGSIQKAKRLDRDSKTPNVRWEITVRPNGDGDVAITLPETTDCDSQGAICTGDRRMLSNRNEFTVGGPGG